MALSIGLVLMRTNKPSDKGFRVVLQPVLAIVTRFTIDLLLLQKEGGHGKEHEQYHPIVSYFGLL